MRHVTFNVLFFYLASCLNAFLNSTFSLEADIVGGRSGLLGKYTSTNKNVKTATPHSKNKSNGVKLPVQYY
jgi:hypothetical protein